MTERLIWVSPDGIEYQISESHWKIDGMSGHFMPPISFVEDESPFQAGTILRNVKVNAREFDLPIYVEGQNEIDLRKKIRYLMRIMNPLKGDGKFKLILSDNSQREITCRYAGGLEISEKKDSKIGNLQSVILVFRAFDPFWYDSSTFVETFTTGQPATFFPLFPLRLSSSTVFADTSVDNQGDVETWPEWIIKGPGSEITIRNFSTGEVTKLITNLSLGESITIDTRPGRKTIKKNDGTNMYASLSDDSSLWALQEGINNIRIEMSNATTDSSVQLSYKPRYLGA